VINPWISELKINMLQMFPLIDGVHVIPDTITYVNFNFRFVAAYFPKSAFSLVPLLTG